MSVRTFFDSNILVYADDASAPKKQRRAIELIAEHRQSRTGVVSLQVVQEYFVAATSKLRAHVLTTRRKVEMLGVFHLVTPDLVDILAAIDLHRQHNFSFWDALIIRSAKQAGCKVLLTEDLQHLREIEGVRIVNPFA